MNVFNRKNLIFALPFIMIAAIGLFCALNTSQHITLKGTATLSLKADMHAHSRAFIRTNTLLNASKWKAISNATIFLDIDDQITHRSTIVQTSPQMRNFSVEVNQPFILGQFSSYITQPLSAQQKQSLRLFIDLYFNHPQTQSLSFSFSVQDMLDALATQHFYIVPHTATINNQTYQIQITNPQLQQPPDSMLRFAYPHWNEMTLVATFLPA